jgi:hypothetical protein
MVVSMNAKGINDEVFKDSSLIHVEQTDDYTSFTPTTSYQKVLFFYPGALVDPDAYAPLCRKIAEHGYQTLIIRMPWRMPTKGYDNIKEMNLIKDTNKKYVLAGHSQGGKMAAQFVYENPGMIDQLILLGTTHPRDIDLSGIPTTILKVYGSNDGLANSEKIMANKSKLPPTAQYRRIEGGNHSQFGYYGFQLGDDKADISREEQQELILAHILKFIESE